MDKNQLELWNKLNEKCIGAYFKYVLIFVLK